MMQEGIQPIKGIDYIEFFVGNAKQAAYYYRHGFGFTPRAFCGLETGARDRYSFLMEQGDIKFLLTAPLSYDHPAAQHQNLHGDGVKDVALLVDDVESAYHEAVKRGAKEVLEPTELEDDQGLLIKATISTYGDTVHTFIDRNRYSGPFMPGFRSMSNGNNSAGLMEIDHVVGNVEEGKMQPWADFYREVLDFERLISYDDKDINTEYTALRSIVMQDHSGRVKFPINEPAQAKRKSQIQEYLDFYSGPGVQHIALSAEDIIRSVTRLRENGIEFLRVPDTYYQTILDRVGPIDENVEDLRKSGILVDRDDEGYLLQIFTKPVEDRPTLFIEIIQRKGSKSFGKGNFRALFESIEREQAERGNL